MRENGWSKQTCTGMQLDKSVGSHCDLHRAFGSHRAAGAGRLVHHDVVVLRIIPDPGCKVFERIDFLFRKDRHTICNCIALTTRDTASIAHSAYPRSRFGGAP